MKNSQLTFALALGVLIGCATSYATRTTGAVAQTTSTSTGFRECVARTLRFDGDHEDLARNAMRVDGWTPVGGTTVQGGAHPAVVLCR